MQHGEIIKPDVDEQLAIDLAKRLYGFNVVSVKEMVSYDDRNFHIKVSEEYCNPYVTSVLPDGYTLKITNTLKSSIPGHFESMHLVMEHTCQKGLHLPMPMRNLCGKTWSMETIPLVRSCKEECANDTAETGLCGVHLLTYIPGVPLGTIDCTADVLYQWGNLLAQFHDALEDFPNETLETKAVFWSLEHIPDLKNFMSGLDENQADLVLEVLSRFPEDILPSLPHLSRGNIHGDFNANNILAREQWQDKRQYQVGEDIQWHVDGILDLEDVHCAAYAWDIAVLLAYVSLESKSDQIEGMGHALAGYLQLRQLRDEEMSILKILITCRLCQSLVMGAYSYSLNPGNSYLLTSAKNGWNILKLIWTTSNESLLDRWQHIRNSYVNNDVS